VQVKAAKMAKLAILDVIGLISNIKIGNSMDTPRSMKLAVA